MKPSDKSVSLPSDVILFINRPHVKSAVREEFKSAGVTNFHFGDTASRCIGFLQQFPDAILVIDWEIGQLEVTKVLESTVNAQRLSFRPILLIAPDMAIQVVGTAAEYHVSRVHTGEISRAKLRDHLQTLMKDNNEALPIRDAMFRVSQARIADEWGRAGDLLNELRQKFPENIRLTAEYAENLMHEDRWEEAGKIAKTLSDRDPANTRGLHLYGRYLMRMRQYPEACEVFKRAKLLNPYNIERLVSLGNALLQIDKVGEARDTFESVLKLQKGRKDAVVGVGECMLMEGDVNEALKMLKEVSNTRELASIFNSAAVLSMRQGRFEIGRTLYHVAMRSVENQIFLLARLLFNLGIGYHRWQKPFEALECFEKALELDAKYADAKHNAILLAHKLGQQARLPQALASTKSGPSSMGVEPFHGDFNENFDEESIKEEGGRKKAS